jgi:hypothetical protein
MDMNRENGEWAPLSSMCISYPQGRLTAVRLGGPLSVVCPWQPLTLLHRTPATNPKWHTRVRYRSTILRHSIVPLSQNFQTRWLVLFVRRLCHCWRQVTQINRALETVFDMNEQGLFEEPSLDDNQIAPTRLGSPILSSAITDQLQVNSTHLLLYTM